MTKKILLAALTAGAIIGLTACSAQESADQSKEEVNLHMNDGRTVHCLWIESRSGGLSCDFDRAR